MNTLLMLCALLSCGQSLGELGRKETERRRSIESQTGAAREVRQADLAQAGAAGNLGTFSPPPARAPAPARREEKSRDSPERYRTALRKLDREIRATEDRLTSLRARAHAERHAPSPGRESRRGTAGPRSVELSIAEQELKLKRLRQDRYETYDAGRRAGFLPGELEGKGIVP